MKLKDFYPYKLLLYIYRRFFEEQPLVLYFICALLLNIMSLFIVAIKGRPENFLIPLHYLLIKGVDKTGPWFYIYKIPLAGFIILVLNFIIVFSLNKKEDAKGAYLLAAATVLLELFVFIAALLIVFKV